MSASQRVHTFTSAQRSITMVCFRFLDGVLFRQIIQFGPYIATPFQAHLSAAKAGVDALSNVLAIEEGPHGVRSNVLSPGPIGETEGFDRLAIRKSGGICLPTFPTGRAGHVKDVANATVFLFSDAASNITGQVLPIDGGFEHVRSVTDLVPYPQAVLDPTSIARMIKPRL
jgi:peroxisomal 2,4-dienoyl-CoA reductase